MDYYSIESGGQVLGVDKVSLRNWAEIHHARPDAVLKDRNGNDKPLYKLETLLALKQLHEKDVIRRGFSGGRHPRNWTGWSILVK